MSAPDLDQIASDLESFEETIITRLIDRAQFKGNPPAYQPGKSGFKGEHRLSLLGLRLKYQEEMDAVFGRFEVPEERPFTSGLPSAMRTVRLPENCLRIKDYNQVNLTADILASYLELVPKICLSGDDAQYGSSVENDVYAIQALSRRIHYGALYVGETKYCTDPRRFQKAVEARDARSLEQMLTRPGVERRILRRVEEKVKRLQATATGNIRVTIDPAVVRNYYEDFVIPLTKKGEVRYLLHRDFKGREIP